MKFVIKLREVTDLTQSQFQSGRILENEDRGKILASILQTRERRRKKAVVQRAAQVVYCRFAEIFVMIADSETINNAADFRQVIKLSRRRLEVSCEPTISFFYLAGLVSYHPCHIVQKFHQVKHCIPVKFKRFP